MLEDMKLLLEYSIFNVSIFKVSMAVVIIILFLLFRQLFAKIIVKYLDKITKKTKTEIDDLIIRAIEIPVRLVFVVIGIWLALKLLELPENADQFASRVMRSLLAFSVFWTVYRASDVLSAFLQKFTEKTDHKIDGMFLPFFRKGLKAMTVVLAIIVIAQEWKYDVGGILAGLGLGGLAFALAAKDTIANLFGGIMIMTDRPFSIGDSIATAHVEGTVEEIGFRSTRIRTLAQALVTIPNSTMSADAITNWSQVGKRRITYKLSVTYDTPVEKIKVCVNQVREMLKAHQEIHQETLLVYFERFGDSGLEILVCFYTKTTVWEKFLEVQEDVNLKVFGILEDLGIEIALPSQRVYIENVQNTDLKSFK